MTDERLPPRTTSRARRRAGFVSGLLAGLAVLALVGTASLLQEPSLLSRATPVAATQDWKPDAAPFLWGVPHQRYLWRNNQTLVWMRRAGAGKGAELVQRDLRTGRETPLPLPPMSFKNVVMSDLQLSPDGKWLLFRDLQTGESRMVAAALDGSRRIVWDKHVLGFTGVPERTLWLPDSGGWVCLGRLSARGYTATVLSISDPRHDSTTLLPMPIAWNSPRPVFLGWRNDGVERRLLALDASQAVPFWIFAGDPAFLQFRFALPMHLGPANVRLAPPPAQPALTLVTQTLNGGDPPRRFSVTLPRNTVAGNVTLSPRGDRLAWLLETETLPPLTRLAQRFFPKHPLAQRPPEQRMALWVSRADGTQMRRVGALTLEPPPPPQVLPNGALQFRRGKQAFLVFRPPARNNNPGNVFPAFLTASPEKRISGLRWTPDGGRLSFVYDDRLWVVPAP